MNETEVIPNSPTFRWADDDDTPSPILIEEGRRRGREQEETMQLQRNDMMLREIQRQAMQRNAASNPFMEARPLTLDPVYFGARLGGPRPASSFKFDAPTVTDLIPVTAEEVHAEFETASDKILDVAKDVLQQSANKMADRLKALGFGKSRIVREEGAKAKKIEGFQLLRDFVARYKKYGKKFIRRDDAIKIAEKYNLVLGPVTSYIGNVPEENLTEIENFLLDFNKKKDGAWGFKDQWGEFSNRGFLTKEEGDHWGPSVGMKPTPNDRIMIVAPANEFDSHDTFGHKMVKRGSVLVQDPVVLMPCIGGYLIVTAWGPEAEDPLVKTDAPATDAPIAATDYPF